MKKLILFIGLLLTGCSTTWHVSTVGHDPIYDTVLEVPAGVQIDTLSASQLRWKLRTDFRFRYDFAQYALSQPRSFDWNNRVLGNRYNVYNPYYNFGYSNYWSRDMMWNDWVWGYNSYPMWSPFRYDRWGYNHYGWNNYGWNSWGWNNWGWNGYYGNGWGWRQQMNNYAWNNRNRPNTVRINGRRGSNNIQRRIVANKPKRNIINNKPRVVINNKPRVIRNKPIFNNNSRPNTTIRTIPNNSTRSTNTRTIRSNSRKKN